MTSPLKDLEARLIEQNRRDGPSVSALALSLKETGFPLPRPTAAQRSQLGDLLDEYLAKLREELLSVLTSNDDCQNRISELGDLRKLVPAELAPVQELISALESDVQQRMQSLQSHEALGVVVAKLRDLEEVQGDFGAFEELKHQFDENSWAMAHPEADLVTRTRDLVGRVEKLARLDVEIKGLPELWQVVDDTEDGLRRAADHLARTLVEATDLGLKARPSLARAAEKIFDGLEAKLSRIEPAAEEQIPSAPDLRQVLGELRYLREIFELVPESLRGERSHVTFRDRIESMSEVVREARDKRARAELEARLVQSTSLAELDTYVSECRTRFPGSRWTGHVEDLQEALQAFERPENDLPEEVLERCDAAIAFLSVSPLITEATTRLDQYRQALSELMTLGNQVQEGTKDADMLDERVQRLQQAWPRWGRVREVKKDVDDIKLHRQLENHVRSGSEREIETALTQVVDFSDRSDEKRQMWTAGLQRLQKALRLQTTLEEHLATASDPGSVDSGFVEAIGRCLSTWAEFAGLSKASDDGGHGKAIEEAWEGVATRMEATRSGEIASAVRAWADRSVASADLGRLDEYRKCVGRWRRELTYSSLWSEVGRSLERRHLVVKLTELERAGRFDDALAVLEDSQSVLEPLERRAQSGSLRRRAALARYERAHNASKRDAGAEKEAIDEILEVVKDAGLDAEVNDLLLRRFMETGDFRALGSVHGLEGAPPESRWCDMVSTEHLDKLVHVWTMLDDASAAVKFLSPLSRATDVAHRTFFLATRFLDTHPALPEADEITVQGVRDAMHDETGRRVEEIGRQLRKIGDEPPPAPESRPAERDWIAELQTQRAAVCAFFEDAVNLTSPAVQSLDEIARWTRDVAVTPSLEAVHEDAKRLDTTMRGDQETIKTLLAVVEQLLGGDSTRFSELGQAQLRTTSALDFRRFLLDYFHGFAELKTAVTEVADAYREGGVGLTQKRLSELTQRVENSGYRFRPSTDRFKLLDCLPQVEIKELFKRLADMMDEVEEVEIYIHNFEELASLYLPQIKSHLQRFYESVDNQMRRSFLEVTMKQLRRSPQRESPGESEAGENSETLEVLLKTPPTVKWSEPSKKKLEEFMRTLTFRSGVEARRRGVEIRR